MPPHPRLPVQQALSLFGAWQDIDTPDALDILDRIRHASKPTPPIDLSGIADLS